MPRVTKKKPRETVIVDRTWVGEQSWYRERIVEIAGTRLRYKVRCNAYDFQSYAKVEVWRDSKWETVHHIAGQQLKTRASYVDRTVTPDRFTDDIAELIRVAYAILGLGV